LPSVVISAALISFASKVDFGGNEFRV